MYVLRLDVPKQTPNHGVVAFLNPSRLRAWLETLPSGNPIKTAQELVKTLSQVNRAEVPVIQRYNLLDQCRPLITDILDTLHKQYIAAAVPLEEKHRLTAELAHALLTETVYGYKAVILATSKTPTAEATRNMLVASAVYAVHHLARLLVDIYGIYAPEPKTLWLELHQIYRYAEKQGFLATTPRQDGKESQVRSDHAGARQPLSSYAGRGVTGLSRTG